MALTLVHEQDEMQDFVVDITKNLDSLQFEQALTDCDVKNLPVHIRKKAKALTATVCAQAVYFVSVINEARQIKEQLIIPKKTRASRLFQETSPIDPTLIGIIGCGRLGVHLAHSLMTFGMVNPEEVKISTRRPETLSELQEKGVMCVSNNKLVASSVHLLFLCILPSQFPRVAEEIKDSISSRCIIYSLMSSTSPTRMKQLLGLTNIIRPKYSWIGQSGNNQWDEKMDLQSILADRRMVELTCPLSFEENDGVVKTDENLIEEIMYAVINMCSMLHLNIQETLDVVHAVIFGETTSQPLSSKLDLEDIFKDIPENITHFPQMDLVSLSMKGTESQLKERLYSDKNLTRSYMKRYCCIFSQYLQLRQFAIEQSK